MTPRGSHASVLWRRKALVVALAYAFAAGQAQANGVGPVVVAGQASFHTAGSAMTITNSPGAIVNWQGFSIGSGETTRFIQQSAASSILNRVIGADPSRILGTLTSNGRVFLINPSGILVGAGARIDVAGLVASTLNLSNQDFLANRLNFTANPLAGKVENQGSITTPGGGSVYLVGSNVTNSGIINSPQGDVILAAGNSVKILDSSTPGVRVELTASDNTAVNLGQILAQSGQVGIYGAALRNAGIIDADQVVRDASGKIVLRAKQDISLDVGSRLSVNGEQSGEITVQSESGTVLVAGTVEARGTGAGAGKGGTIKLLGNMQAGILNVGGTLDASAVNDGDGGFIETSAARVNVADSIVVTTRSARGKSGIWLIDPADFTIAAAGGNMSGTTLGTSLAGGSVTILSSAGTAGGNGDINVNAAVSWSANALTLTAARDININAVMTASGTSSLLMNTATANGADGAVAGGTVRVGMNAGGFTGRVDFPSRSGTGFLTINGLGYTVINALGASTSTAATDLQGMKSGLALNYALGTNIDATDTSTWNSGAGFTPVGSAGTPFTGNFDGLGHTITALAINLPVTASVGLFGASGTTSSFRNVGLVGGSVTGAAGTGGLVGTNGAGSTIGNSYNTGSVSGAAGSGGLVGDNGAGSAISNSYATGSVSGAVGTGGLVGTNADASAISNSYATGTVTSSGAGTGGLVGSNTTGTISNSYAAGSVSSSGASTGGLVGRNTSGAVSTSYATGSVSGGGADVGGLIGTNSSGAVIESYAAGFVGGTGTGFGGLMGANTSGAVTRSFWDKTTTTRTSSAGGGTGMTTAEMQTQANFTSATTANGLVDPAWGFPGTWVMYDGHTYPLLQSFMTPLTVTANDAGTTYGQANPAFGVGYSSAPNGNLLGTVSYSGNSQTAINAGNYVITPSGLYSNQQGYIIAYADGTLTVAKAALTITADDKNKIYGAAEPALTASYSPFQYGETSAVVSGLTLATATGAAAGAGTHTIDASGASAANYAITEVDGTLTVAKAALTITADDKNKIYGAAEPALTYTTGAFQFGDTAGSVLSGVLSRVAGEDVSSYAIGQNTLASNANYTIVYTGNNLAITPASLNVVANLQSKLYGTPDPVLSFSITGLVNNPALGVVDTENTVLSGALTRVPGEAPLGGPYAINQGSLAANDNYTLGFTGNDFIIVGTAVVPGAPYSLWQAVFSDVLNNQTYYRPGNFWHVSLNIDNADPGFDVMRGTEDGNSRASRRRNSCDSVFGGGFCETWSFPQQRTRGEK